MSITFFGFLWLIVLIYIFGCRRLKDLIPVVFFSMLLQCNNVIVINEQGVGPQVLTSFVFVLKSILVRYKNVKYVPSRNLLVSLFCFLLYIMVNCVLNGTLNTRILDLLQILIYYLCAFQLYKNKWIISDVLLKKYVIRIIYFIAIFSPIQLLATYGIIPRGLLSLFFFNDPGNFVYFNHPEIYRRLLGTFMEPSYCSSFLVGAVLYVFHLRNELRNFYKLLAILIVELILTMSSTGYGALVVMAVIYLLCFPNKQTLKIALPIGVLALIFYVLTKDNILNGVIFDKMNSGSGIHRNNINVLALNTFIENPILGIGWKETRASSFLLSLLAELGIVGLFLFSIIFCLALIQMRSKTLCNKNGQAVRLFFISVCITQFIAIPDIQLTTFWLSIYFIAVSHTTYNNESLKTI